MEINEKTAMNNGFAFFNGADCCGSKSYSKPLGTKYRAVLCIDDDMGHSLALGYRGTKVIWCSVEENIILENIEDVEFCIKNFLHNNK